MTQTLDQSEDDRPGPEARVTLREVGKDTVREICGLAVAPGQEDFVAPNAVSIAEAHFEPKAWFRAIYANDAPVGFVMLFDDPETPDELCPGRGISRAFLPGAGIPAHRRRGRR